MVKIKDKINQKINKNLNVIVDKVGEQLYRQLKVIRYDMDISLDDVMDSSSSYNSFWELVAKYYNDYVDMEDYEDASN